MTNFKEENPKHQNQRFAPARSLVRNTLTLVVFIAIGVTAWKLNQQLDLTGSLLTSAFLLGTLLAIAYRITNPFGWALVLRGFGQNVSANSATRIWLLAESRRWLPGGVWGYASRAVASKELGVPVSVASVSMLVELLVTIAAAVIVSLVGVGLYWQELSATMQGLLSQSGIKPSYVIGVIVGSAIVVAFGFTRRNELRRKLRGLAEKASALTGSKFQPRMLVASLGYFVGMACLNGVVNQTLLHAIYGAGSVPVIAMIAATATAWIIGFLAFFSPGGILIREATLAALLLPWLPYEIGFSLAMLSRFAQLAAEVVGMLVVMAPNKGKQRQSQPA